MKREPNKVYIHLSAPITPYMKVVVANTTTVNNNFHTYTHNPTW